MNLLTIIFGSKKVNPSPQAILSRPEPSIDFHLMEAHRLCELGEYYQALFHTEEVLDRQPTHAPAGQLKEVVRDALKDKLINAETIEQILRQI